MFDDFFHTGRKRICAACLQEKDEAVEKRNTAALIFISKTQLRQRGYNERVDINMNANISVSWEGLFSNGDSTGNEGAEETSAGDSE